MRPIIVSIRHLVSLADGKPSATAQRAVKLSDSAKLLYDIVHRLITDVKALLTASAHVQARLVGGCMAGSFMGHDIKE